MGKRSSGRVERAEGKINLGASPGLKRAFIVDTDATDEGFGAVLSQEQDGQEKVIGYGSRTQTKKESRYCVTPENCKLLCAS